MNASLELGKEQQVHAPPSPGIQTQEWEESKEGKLAQFKVSMFSLFTFLSQVPGTHLSDTLGSRSTQPSCPTGF